MKYSYNTDNLIISENTIANRLYDTISGLNSEYVLNELQRLKEENEFLIEILRRTFPEEFV